MWDNVFEQPGFAYGTQPNDFLTQVVHVIPKGARVLMLADGEGRNGVYMAQQGYEVVSVDSSAIGLQKAQQLAAERCVTITTECVDLAEYSPAPNSFDAVISIFCHLPPELQQRVYRMCDEVLKPDGYLLLESYTPKQLEYKTGGPPKADMMATLDKLIATFPDYQLHLGQEIERSIKEGRLHDGHSAVVQLVIQKPSA